jgi:hypothetical protein
MCEVREHPLTVRSVVLRPRTRQKDTRTAQSNRESRVPQMVPIDMRYMS